MRRRVEVFIGPFGSGKTEVALNRALALAAAGSPVTLVDLDLVDPFFRARQVRAALAAAGITVVAPEGEWEGADLPLLIPQVFGALQRPGHVLLDVGGETQGTLVLRQIQPLLPADVEVFLAVNPYWPAMGTPLRIGEMCQALEAAGNVRLSPLASAPHLAEETTPEVVRQGHGVVCCAAALLGIPVRWLAVHARLVERISLPIEVLPLRLFMRPPWEEQGRPARRATEDATLSGGPSLGQGRH